MKTEKRAILLTVIAVIIMGSSVTLYQITAPPDAKVAQFIDASILGASFDSDGVPRISVGQYAIITIDVEKLEEKKIDDILIRSSFENRDSGQFLYIDNKKIHPGVDRGNLDITEENVVGEKIDPFGGRDTTGPVTIKVIAIDNPRSEHVETINVVLFADGQEMDRRSFDVIVNSGF